MHISLLQCLNVQTKRNRIGKSLSTIKIITNYAIVDKTSCDKKVYN